MNALGKTFDEGLGQGGFLVTVRANSYIIEPFNTTPETIVVKQTGIYGQTVKKAGVLKDRTASATVQVPFDNSENPLWMVEGDTFTDPDNIQWWVSDAPISRKAGEVHKQEIKLEQKLTA